MESNQEQDFGSLLNNYSGSTPQGQTTDSQDFGSLLNAQSTPQQPKQTAPKIHSVEQFVKDVEPAAQRVAQRLNVPVESVIGQWGLETRWGKSVIPNTNNLGNIKSTDGSGVAATDNQNGSRDRYRQYDSVDSFADDFSNLLNNKRYSGALNAKDATTYFSGLKAGGYAEAPDYVQSGVKASRMAAQFLTPRQQQQDPLDSIPDWKDVEAKPEYQAFTPTEKQQAKEAYFDRFIAPVAGADAGKLREQFLMKKERSTGQAITDTAQNLAAAALKIGPTALKGAADIANMATGDKYDFGVSDAMEKGMQSINQVVGTEEFNRQQTGFEQIMQDDTKGIGDMFTYMIDNPSILVDNAITTVGSMFLPAGAAKGAISASKALGASKQLAKKAAVAASIGTAAVQNAADTFSELKNQPLDQRYQGASVSAAMSILAGIATEGGAEGAIAKKMAGDLRSGKVGLDSVKDFLKAVFKEGAQESGEEVGNIAGESIGSREMPNLQNAAKRTAFAGTLGGIMGGGTDVLLNTTPDGRLEQNANGQPATPAEPAPVDVHPTQAAADQVVQEAVDQFGVPDHVVASELTPQQTTGKPSPTDDDVANFAESRLNDLLTKRDGTLETVIGENGPEDQEVPGAGLSAAEQAELDALFSAMGNPQALRKLYFDQPIQSDQSQLNTQGNVPAPETAQASQPTAGQNVPNATEPALEAAQNEETQRQTQGLGLTPGESASEPTGGSIGTTEQPQPAVNAQAATTNGGDSGRIASEQDGAVQTQSAVTHDPIAFESYDAAKQYISTQRRNASTKLPEAKPFPYGDGSFGVAVKGSSAWDSALQYEQQVGPSGTVKEPVQNIIAQVKAYANGSRGPVFVDSNKGLTESVLRDNGMRVMQSKFGGFYVVKKADAPSIAAIEKNNDKEAARAQILGYVQSKDELDASKPVSVVQATDANGAVVHEQAVNQDRQGEAQANAAPIAQANGGEVNVTTPEQAIQERATNEQAQKDQAAQAQQTQAQEQEAPVAGGGVGQVAPIYTDKPTVRKPTAAELALYKDAQPAQTLDKKPTKWKQVEISNGRGVVLVSEDGEQAVTFREPAGGSGTDAMRATMEALAWAVDNPYTSAQPAAPKTEKQARAQKDYSEKRFGTQDNAQAFIDKQGIGSTHEVVQDGKRFLIGKRGEEVRRGIVGDRLKSGEIVLTNTGRKTTPFPQIKTENNRQTSNTIKKVDEWLFANALAEAEARGDEFNARQFRHVNLKNNSPADRDNAETYLFDDYIPPVLPSIFKNPEKAAQVETPVAEKPTTEKEANLIKAAKELGKLEIVRVGDKPKQQPATEKQAKAQREEKVKQENMIAKAGDSFVDEFGGDAWQIESDVDGSSDNDYLMVRTNVNQLNERLKQITVKDLKERIAEDKQFRSAAVQKREQTRLADEKQQPKNTIFTEDAAEKARALLKSKLGQLNSGIDPEIMQAGITLAGYHIEKGARTFAAYSKAMLDDMGDMVKPYLKSWYLGVKFDPRAAGFDGMDDASVVEKADVDAAPQAYNQQNTEDSSNDTKRDQAESQRDQSERANDQSGAGQENKTSVALDASENVPTPTSGQSSERPRAGSASSDVGSGESVRKGGNATNRRKRTSGEGVADDGTRSERGSSPVVESQRGNYHIDDPEALIGGTPKVRFARNKKAIEASQSIISEGRAPTQDELDAMAAYIGWGSFGQELFQGTYDNPRPKDGWQKESDWLREHLGKDEWEGAQKSIINAHYTDPITVGAMWDMVRQLGFKGGKTLEPSMGIGNFFGLMPKDLAERSALAGIEMDSLTGGMAKILYPEANIQIKPYQDSKTADNFYDLVIGNWPFAKDGPADRRYMKLSPSLHDYFFLKALDQTRPGGLVVGITSAGTMDKKGTLTRAAIAQKADLVAAFRLPSGAFEKYAGTSVVTDIIILKKRETPNTNAKDSGWLNTTEVDTPSGNPVTVNEYFANNPDKVLGTLNFGTGTTYGRPAMIVNRPNDLEQRIRNLASTLPAGVFEPVTTKSKTVQYVTNNTTDRQQSIIEQNGKLLQVQGEYLAPLNEVVSYTLKDAKKTQAREQQIKQLVGLRRAYGELIDAERQGLEDTEAKRKALRDKYNAFTNEYGTINGSDGLSILKRAGDPFYPSLAALETPEGTPSAIINRPTVRAKRHLEKPSVKDALVLARNESIDLNLDRVAELSGVPVADAANELIDNGAVFKTPDGNYEVSDVYLSGNVRRKLREAQDAAEQGVDMRKNIAALEKVLPDDVPYYNIEAKLGATWVKPEQYVDFISHLLGVTPSNDVEVRWAVNRWKVTFHKKQLNNKPEATTTWGHPAVRFEKIVNAAFGNTTVTVQYKDEDGNLQTDEQQTAEANNKIQQIREEFSNWLWSDSVRKIELEQTYNEVMNAIALPKYDGSFLSFEGMALQRGENPFNLRKHQVDAIWRGLANGRSINAHEVGTGKTYTMGGLAIESRRYGIAKKPIIFAHNANSASVAREIGEMYPGAKLLYIDNLAPEKIGVTLRQIANDDWDAVVVPHSLIDRFTLKRETLMEISHQQIEAIEQEAIDAAQEDGVNLEQSDLNDPDKIKKLRSPTAKQLVHARNAILKKIDEMAMKSSREDAISFEDMGIDMVIVDEAHEFKKPSIATRMRMKGLNTATSAQSISMMLLTDYVKKINNGRGVHLFTGTPITNTLTEIYVHMRYVMDDQMSRDGLNDWDAWFNTFADSTSDVELTASGEYEPVTRLASFVNVAELRRMIGQYMDIVFADDMPEFKPRETDSGKTLNSPNLNDKERSQLINGRSENPIGRPYKKVISDIADMTPQQKDILGLLQQRANEFKNATRKARREMMLSGSPNSPVIVETDSANAGLDARLFDIHSPDAPSSKVNRAVNRIMEHYNEHPLATQVVFVERGFTSESVSRKKDASTGTVTTTKKERFNLVKDMIKKLEAKGVPADQIAVVDGSTSKEKRKAIADAMNRAEIRVVIGNTKTLGVGVNMQTNLRAMHHLDAPWMPGDLEQRNGRGHRQGNKWNTVMEYRYLTERIDGRRWQVLAVKDRFIKSFLKAKDNVRVIDGDAVSLEEEGDIGSTLADAAGDPRLMLMNKLRSDVQKLENKERMHAQGIFDATRKVKSLERDIQQWTNDARIGSSDDERFRNAVKEPLDVEIKGKHYKTTEEANAALAKRIETVSTDGVNVVVAKVWGSLIVAKRLGSSQTLVHVETPSGIKLEMGKPTIESARATLYQLKGQVEKIASDVSQAKDSLSRLVEATKAPFARADDLAKKRTMLSDIEADIQANPVPAPSWLRSGAPIGSEAFIDSKPVVIEGHRWTDDGYFVTVTKDDKTSDVDYMDIKDENGLPVYEAHEFEAPKVIQPSDASNQPKTSRSDATTNPHDVASLTDRLRGVADANHGKGFFDALVGTGKFKVVSEDEAKKIVGSDAKFHKAWHGSSHKFDKFSFDNIGSGEGEQAFGYGLYFADLREVSEFYQTKDGGMYQVELAPKQYDYIEWEKPFSEQSEFIKSKLDGTEIGNLFNKSPNWQDVSWFLSDSSQEEMPLFGLKTSDYYERQKALSNMLRDMGVRGIKYKDGVYREKVNYSYVIFDDSDITIEAKYSKNGDIKAFYNPADDTTYFVADNISKHVTDDNLNGLLLHEVGVHAMTLGKDDAAFAKIKDQFSKMRRVSPAVEAAYARAERAGTPSDEEALGYFVEANPKSSITQRLVAWIKNALRSLGLSNKWTNSLSEADVIAMATSALRRAPSDLMFDANARGEVRASKDALLAPNGKPSNLNAMQHAQVRTPEFKAWFGDWENDPANASKVVDENGEPLVVYHKTNKDFTAFDPNKSIDGWGIHFGTKQAAEDLVKSGTGEGNYLMPVFLNIREVVHTDYDAGRWGLAQLKDAWESYWSNSPNEIKRRILKKQESDGMRTDMGNAYGKFMYYKATDTVDLTDKEANKLMADGLAKYGMDGISYKNAFEDKGTTSYIVMDSNQIKSATGNTGAFSKTDNDIRFSKSDERASFSGVTRNVKNNLMQFFGNQKSLKTWNTWDKTLATQFHKALKDKHYGKVFNIVNAMQNEVSLTSIRPAELAPGILPRVDDIKTAAKVLIKGKKADSNMDKAANALFAGTLAGENVMDGKVWSEEELRNNFGLNDAGVALYKQARAAIDASLDETAAAEGYAMAQGFVPKALRAQVINNPQVARDLLLETLEKQVKTLDLAIKAAQTAGNEAQVASLNESRKAFNETITKVGNIFSTARNLKNAGYAPLMRFGNFAVTVKVVDPVTGRSERDVDGKPVTLFYSQFESEAEAQQALKKMNEIYANRDDVRITAGTKSKNGHEMYAGISPETIALFAEAVGVGKTMETYYRNALTERSALKRRLERKGTAGFSSDMPRVLSNFITSNGRFAAQRYYLRDLNNAIKYIPKEKGDVIDEAIELKKFIANPNDPAAPVSSALFAWFLGGSVASAVINLSQPIMMTGPYLSQFGMKEATAGLTKAIPYALGKKQITDNALKEGLKRASQEGIVDAQEIFHLYSVGAQSVASGLVNTLSRLPAVVGKVKAGSESARARVNAFLTLWGSMFATAESFNRKLTFIAAWDVAKATNKKNPYEFAVRAVNETQGIYNKVNRPNLARGPVGRVVMTFKQYSIMYAELLSRMYKHGGPEGKRAALIMLAVLMLAAGEEGLPFAQDLDDLIDTIGQLFFKSDTNMRRNKRRVAHELLGENLGDLFLYGISSELPIDFSGRMGMGNLIPGTSMLKPSDEQYRTRQVEEVFGAGAGMLGQIGDAFDAATESNWGKAGQNLLPTAIKNAAAAVQMAGKGYATDTKGRKLVETTGLDAVGKAIGFQPTKVADETRRTAPVQQDIALQKKTEASIVDQWARGVADNDQATIDKAAKRLNDWNESNPKTPIAIKGEQIRDKARQFVTDKNARLLKTTPREMRGGVGLDLIK